MIGLLLAAILVLQPAQRTNPLLQGGTVTGRVLTADGIPAAAIRVSAMQAPATGEAPVLAVLTDIESGYKALTIYSPREVVPGEANE